MSKLNKVEIPYDKNRLKFFIYSIFPIAIIVLLIDIYYTLNTINFNIYFSIFLFLIFLIFIYYSIKSILVFIKDKPCIIFDEEKITSCSIFGAYSLDINLFENYKFVEFNGINFVNIYPKNYKEFKKQLGFHLFRRFIYYQIKSNGFEGPMISFFTLSTNYQQAIDYLNNIFKKN